MREKFRLLLSDRTSRYALFLSFAASFVGLSFFLIKVWNLPPLIPLFYNRPWGLYQLGSPIHLFILLFVSLGLLVLNLTLALRFYSSIILLARILLWVSALVSLLSTTVVIRVILVVT